MINNVIEEVQRQYMYAVQPVNLFEAQNSKAAQQNTFDFINQMNKNGHNPCHPDVSNTSKGQKLDIMS